MSQADQTVRLNVSGMSCGHCQRAVEEAIRQVPKVASASVDLTAGTATIQGQPDLHRVIKAIEEAGYQATAAPRE